MLKISTLAPMPSLARPTARWLPSPVVATHVTPPIVNEGIVVFVPVAESIICRALALAKHRCLVLRYARLEKWFESLPKEYISVYESAGMFWEQIMEFPTRVGAIKGPVLMSKFSFSVCKI
eukprot:XP_001707590.1 Hypothetical protein GL50803_88901 [Giardia lamblia ATCC 50803]